MVRSSIGVRGGADCFINPQRHRAGARVFLFRGGTRSALGGQAAHQGRGAAAGGELRQAAGAAAAGQ